MDIKPLLEALSDEARSALEIHFVNGFLRDVITDLRSERYDESREWAKEVEEDLLEHWGSIEGL